MRATTDSNSGGSATQREVNRLHVATEHLDGLLNLLLNQAISSDGGITKEMLESMLGLACNLSDEVRELQAELV